MLVNRSTIKVFVFCVACMFSGSVIAETKIGFVNPIKVLEQAPQAATARQKLEKDFQPRKDEIITAQKKVQKLEQNLVRDADTMSESARRLLERDIISQKRDLRRVQEEYREDLNLRRNEELGQLQREISNVIKQIAEEGKYDLIVGEAVIYASDAIDITNKVLERLKQTNSKRN
ncbi:MAG: OmpH family outer membrane protein [Gammaproteobacteria bacterium]|nr:OmpH family outer membrane protein [Gammaproteobacteria bacterium]